jgi:hypothetical protein
MSDEIEVEGVEVTISQPSVVGRAKDALMVLGGREPSTFLIDLAEWPPRVTTFVGEYVLAAARGSDGTWLCHACRGNEMPRVWRLAYAEPGARALTRDEPIPFALPDLTEVLAHMDDVSARIERAHTHAIADIVAFGRGFVLVPRHAGIGARRWPFVRGADGWKEEKGLPPYATSAADPERALVKSVALGDDAEVLLWAGAAFERVQGSFARTFEQRIDAPWWEPWDLVANGEGGFFWLSTEDGIQEARPGKDPVQHLPELSRARSISAGPPGTLLVRAGDDLRLYDPRARTIATFPESLDVNDVAYVTWATPGLVLLRRDGWIDLVRAQHVLAMPRRPIADAGLTEPKPEPAPSMTGTFATSRARVACSGELIAIATRNEVRVHAVDAPRWRTTFESEVVSVAATSQGFAVLLASGTVQGLDDAGEPRWSHAGIANPRAIVGSRRGDVAVLALSGVWLFDADHAVRGPFEAPIAAAFDDAGRLLVMGERQRALFLERGVEGAELREVAAPPADVRALVYAGGGWLGLAGDALVRFDGREWHALEGDHFGAHLAISIDGRRIAAERSTRSVWVGAPGNVGLFTTYGSEYSAPAREPMSITGLAFLDDDRVVVALDGGRANILDGASALKLDPFEGDPPSRWILIHAGQVLLAG